MATATTADLARDYFRAWQERDAHRMRALLADDVAFDGPLGHERGADDCATALMRLAAMTTALDVELVVTDGPDAITKFALTVDGTTLRPVFNHSHVTNGRITAIHVAFDPRPLLGADG